MPANNEPPTATYRDDPYRGYKFRLKWGGKYVAGVSKVSSLASNMPGQSAFPAITLERGVTHDPDFAQWAGSGQDAPLRDLRRDVVMEVYDQRGHKVLAYNICRCRPSEFFALPEFDGNGGAVAFSMLKLENEGWTRDDMGQNPI